MLLFLETCVCQNIVVVFHEFFIPSSIFAFWHQGLFCFVELYLKLVSFLALIRFVWEMPEKVAVSQKQWILSSPMHQWRFGVLTALVFIGMVAVWSIDGCTIKNLVEAWRLQKERFVLIRNANVTQIVGNHTSLATSNPLAHIQFLNLTSQIPEANLSATYKTHKGANFTSQHSNYSAQRPPGVVLSKELVWLSAELEPNLTTKLLARWLAPGGERCKDWRTVAISIPGLDDKNGSFVELSAGEIHEFVFHALDESGKFRCSGGDYFETDLSGDSWKSRPLVKDFDNGSYSVSLQVHPDFAGLYNLSVILLYRHFEGLRFSPGRFVFDKQMIHVPVRFSRGKVTLPALKTCQMSDFDRNVWSGRWTRHGKNDACEISYDGRYRCLPADFPCQSPWCDGALGKIESNGWVYSTHCSFRIFTGDSAWNCLKDRWIFFWGDSNHVDTIRNMLNFVLDLPDVHSVPRRFDKRFSNPRNASQTVRITSIFNGHSNDTMNYQGLDSLREEGFRNLLKKFFSESTVPDTMIMNSGLHDGVHFHNIRGFAQSATYAASFWKEVMESVKERGLVVPRIFYRNTVSTGGYARSLAFNPSKMEAFNGVLLDQLRQAGLVSGVIDNFDMTNPWHFDNRCNDGVHYGRAPLKMKWRDGQIGHQYFVDLMLGHVLLNAMCV